MTWYRIHLREQSKLTRYADLAPATVDTIRHLQKTHGQYFQWALTPVEEAEVIRDVHLLRCAQLRTDESIQILLGFWYGGTAG